MALENSRKREKCSCEKASIEKHAGGHIQFIGDFWNERYWICSSCFYGKTTPKEDWEFKNYTIKCSCCDIRGDKEEHYFVKLPDLHGNFKHYCFKCMVFGSEKTNTKTKWANDSFEISEKMFDALELFYETSKYESLWDIEEEDGKFFMYSLELGIYFHKEGFPQEIRDLAKENLAKSIAHHDKKRKGRDEKELVLTIKKSTNVSCGVAQKVAKRLCRARVYHSTNACSTHDVEHFLLWMSKLFPAKYLDP